MALPAWATAILAPGTEADFHDGILRLPLPTEAEGIRQYRAIGGARFHERRHVAFSMSALETPLYHAHLDAFRGDKHGVVVDIGGGDGRNAWPFLEWGHTRLVVIDAAGDALLRFRARIEAQNPAWLDRVLLIEADARDLPLVSGCADRVFAIEALYYLNDDYEIGLREARRLLALTGKLLLSERDWENGLLMRALYHGIEGVLQTAAGRTLFDGDPAAPMRTRCFTEAELLALLAAEGLRVERNEGMPVLSLVLGWLNAQGRIAANGHRDAMTKLLVRLATEGRARRCHVITAGLA